MLLRIAEPDSLPPTKQHINACWQANPRLNPAAFRESLHLTTGKLWLDLRHALPHASTLIDAWQSGLNGWLLSPATLAALRLPPPIARQTLALALHTPITEAPPQPLDLLFWQPATSPEAARDNLTQLESLAQNGAVAAYGLALETPPLHQWLQVAEQAAQTVHHRRKRPALRAFLMPLNFTQTAALHQPLSQHHGEPVAPLEHAARLGFLTLAAQATDFGPAASPTPLTTPFTAPPEALAALTQAAQAEQHLHALLGGWPTISGQTAFNLLTPLSKGQPPFASPADARHWAAFTLPQTLLAWQNLGLPEAEPYLNTLRHLAFYAVPLGQAAAAQATARLLQALPPFPPKMAENPASAALQLVTSLPGITGALVTPQQLQQTLPLMQQTDFPDPSPWFPPLGSP